MGCSYNDGVELLRRLRHFAGFRSLDEYYLTAHQALVNAKSKLQLALDPEYSRWTA
jgi:hypothetical protein